MGYGGLLSAFPKLFLEFLLDSLDWVVNILPRDKFCVVCVFIKFDRIDSIKGSEGKL